MRVGPDHAVSVGDLVVTMIGPGEWIVRDWTRRDVTGVAEDPEGFGWLGEAWAIAAVVQAEQLADLTEADPFAELERSPRPEWVNRKAVSVRRGERC